MNFKLAKLRKYKKDEIQQFMWE